jgi:hypothetical protein
MVWLLRTFVVGIFVAVLAFAIGAITLQQGGPGSTPAAIGSILLIAAVPLGLLTFVALTIRAAIRRATRPRGGARHAQHRAATPASAARKPAARPRR